MQHPMPIRREPIHLEQSYHVQESAPPPPPYHYNSYHEMYYAPYEVTSPVTPSDYQPVHAPSYGHQQQQQPYSPQVLAPATPLVQHRRQSYPPSSAYIDTQVPQGPPSYYYCPPYQIRQPEQVSGSCLLLGGPSRYAPPIHQEGTLASESSGGEWGSIAPESTNVYCATPTMERMNTYTANPISVQPYQLHHSYHPIELGSEHPSFSDTQQFLDASPCSEKSATPPVLSPATITTPPISEDSVVPEVTTRRSARLHSVETPDTDLISDTTKITSPIQIRSKKPQTAKEGDQRLQKLRERRHVVACVFCRGRKVR